MSLLKATRDAVLAIDQGTTNTKALCVGRDGTVSCRVSVPVRMLETAEGWSEQAPDELWSSCEKAAAECLRLAEDAGLRVGGVALSNQRETAVAWHRETGEPLMNAISWQCTRSARLCGEMAGEAETIQRKTGLPLHPVVSASKWKWMLRESALAERMRDLARQKKLCLGTVDAWLVFKLTSGKVFATDHTNASRTALLNLETLGWDGGLAEMFGVPLSALPRVQPSASEFGVCSAPRGLEDAPIVSVAGDSHAALAAYGDAAGMVKATYGTGSSLMMALDELPKDSGTVARTVAWSTTSDVRYALEGNIAMTGSAVQWVGEFLGLPRPTEDCVALAETVTDAAGVMFVPGMAGLGAPWWDGAARGSVHGLGRSHRAAHLARAAMDAIAFQVADVFDAMKIAAGTELDALRADGGASRNDRLMQFQADVLGGDVLRSATEELSSVGAAWLGGMTLGWWKTPAEPAAGMQAAKRFCARMTAEDRRELRERWRDAVRRTLTQRTATREVA
ncbi:MAG TPA: FGGY family carbohydrate kinase [Acidobacteriaceae bacterium]|jgi:glycerol kinase|nr:FGGY family carbohydrate kinase [Acidobacteriaceae bacterium]